MSSIKIDQQYAHSDDIGEVVGYFHDTPIHLWDPNTTAVREARDLTKRLAVARLAKEGPNGVPA